MLKLFATYGHAIHRCGAEANYRQQNIKENIEGHAVDWYNDVFDIVFPGVDHDAANLLWKEQLKEPEKKDKEDDGD